MHDMCPSEAIKQRQTLFFGHHHFGVPALQAPPAETRLTVYRGHPVSQTFEDFKFSF